MSAELLKGAAVTAALKERLIAETAQLKAAGITPTLAILRVGAREDDLSYERTAMKRCQTIGAEAKQVTLPGDVGQDELMAQLKQLNEDPGVHGILMFRPLPKQLDEEAVRAALNPEKDVDGVTDGSLAGVFAGTGTGFTPCTAQACMEILNHYGVDLTGKRVTVIGRSLVVGRPAALLALGKDATVTLCHTKTAALAEEARRADVLIVAAGKARTVGGECLREGQVVIDVGIHMTDDGTMCGDVRFEEAEPIVKAITPVPGGVGAVTSWVLTEHVVAAAKRRLGK